MKISTKGRYGTRAMLELASNYQLQRTPAGQISEAQGISLKYLESLLVTLKSAGLVTSEKGWNGGYSLARSPGEITLYEVLHSLEDSLNIVECTTNPDECERLESCVTREVWMQLRAATDGILKSISLNDLLERKKVLERTRVNRTNGLTGVNP